MLENFSLFSIPTLLNYLNAKRLWHCPHFSLLYALRAGAVIHFKFISILFSLLFSLRFFFFNNPSAPLQPLYLCHFSLLNVCSSFEEFFVNMTFFILSISDDASLFFPIPFSPLLLFYKKYIHSIPIPSLFTTSLPFFSLSLRHFLYRRRDFSLFNYLRRS